jgi:hypothetical protein
MSKFTYTLPSGTKYVLNAPSGTTQLEADKIFYSQVAAGSLVGYKPGDILTSPATILTNFGLSRLQRKTAGVDEKTLLAIVSGLPIVAPIPSLPTASVQNPISQADFVQVLSNPRGNINGLVDIQPQGIGPLTPVQVQALMAQLAAVVDQPSADITQEKGVGKYGFNSVQLERAGYIKPGFSNRYCRLNATTQQNPTNFVSYMKSPAPWTGVNGVTTVDDILANDALQNQIQHNLMSQSYDGLVATGTIIPPTPTVTTPSVSTGQVYTNDGILTSITPLTLLTSSGIGINSTDSNLLRAVAGNALVTLNSLNGLNGNISSLPADPPVGTISSSLSSLGPTAVAIYNSGITSLSSGAVGFSANPTSLTNAASSILSSNGANSLLGGGSVSSLLSSNGVSNLLGNNGVSNLLNGSGVSNLLGNNGVSNLLNGSGVSNLLSGGGLSQLGGLASAVPPGIGDIAGSLTTSLNGDIGALVNNASKYGVDVTNAWASASSEITSVTSDLTGGITTNFGSGITDNISNLTDGLSSSFGDLTGGLGGSGFIGTEGYIAGVGDLSSLGSGVGDISNLTSGLSGGLGDALGSLGASSVFSVGFSAFSSGGLDGGTSVAGAFSNTVDRSKLDAAAVRIIGSNKITPPSYDLPSFSSLGASADINFAQSILGGLQNAAAGLLTSAGIPSNISNQAVKIAGNLFG